MSEKEPSQVDIHEDFLQHVEDGSSKMRLLSGITVIIALILVVSYLSQLALPLTGTTTVTVNLTDPTLLATEMVVLVLALAWLYVGIGNYRFMTNLSRQVASARAAEAEMQKKLTT